MYHQDGGWFEDVNIPSPGINSIFTKGFPIHNQQKPSITETFFFSLGFIPCKVEQPIRGMELPEKEAEKDQSIQKIGKHSIDREFQSLAVQGKKQS